MPKFIHFIIPYFFEEKQGYGRKKSK